MDVRERNGDGMSGVLANSDPKKIENEELANVVRQLHTISNGGYDMWDANHNAIVKLLKKALKLAKREKEWYVYFDGIYNIIYQYQRKDSIIDIVKYAEIFYHDSALYMDEALAMYPGTDLNYLNTWIYYTISIAYCGCYQIDDSKMDIFMKQFEENAVKYGKTYCYYWNEMTLGIEYRDLEMVKHGARYFEKYENEMESCYVCGHVQYIGYYLLSDNRQRAEEVMLDFIHRRIPKKHLWCYKYCEEAESGVMYARTLWYCITLGRVDDFRYFYKKYWVKQPVENQRRKKSVEWHSISIYLCAAGGNFIDLHGDIEEAQENGQSAQKHSASVNIRNGLCWWCYFALLDRSGVHEVQIDLQGVEENCCGAEPEDRAEMQQIVMNQNADKEEEQDKPGSGTRKVSCQALSRYFENLADDYGMKFAAARKKYDYQALKSSYWECAGLE